MTRLVLAGGGHSHLAVLQALARTSLSGIEVILVTPTQRQVYSGMLPGWIAGHYAREQCEIDLERLAHRANVRVRLDSISAMDATRRCVALASGEQLDYDLLSLDVGSEVDTSWLELLGERTLPVRPGSAFLDRWPAVLNEARQRSGYQWVVVGGGAAGVEIALAVQHVVRRAGNDGAVVLVAPREGLLAGYSPGVRARIERIAATAGLRVCPGPAVGTSDGVLLADGEMLPADCVIAATGGLAPCWLRVRGPSLDEHGFVIVDESHRSVSHEDVFAAGDVCARPDAQMARSGVHAVHAGRVLAANLIASLSGRPPPRRYWPRRRSLYLLACGSKTAVASWGRWSTRGGWVWRWKDRIDRRFIHLHSASETDRRAVSARMMPVFRAALSRPIVSNSVRVALVVGTVLNAVNQGSTILAGGPVSWTHLLLNYLVPYCVASYSGATVQLQRERDE
jgi:pyridine nucleotide-disulfide oxidoreductase family protein